MKLKIKGFTLVELVITIAIIIILSLISAPMYTEHVKKAKMSEAYAILAEIRDAQIRYYNEYREFLNGWTTRKGIYDTTKCEPVLGVDIRGKKHFKSLQLGWGASPGNKWFFSAWTQAAGERENYFSKLNRLSLVYNLTSGATYSWS